jgi:class 3 adenylate cyclase
MYIIHTDPQGKVRDIEDVKNLRSFDPAQDPAAYKKVQEWIRDTLKLSLDLNQPLPYDSVLLLNEDVLVEHCKKHGIMLYANRGFSSIGPISLQAFAFCNLDQAWAWSSLGGELDRGGLTGHPTNKVISQQLRSDLDRDVQNEDSKVRRISSIPIDRTFAYLDISDFSKYKPGQEALIINSLIQVVHEESFWTGLGKGVFLKFEAMLCIGDGYIFVFKDPMEGAYFAAYLAQLIETLVANKLLPVEFHFRMGVHVGPVYSFWDPGRKDWNYIGDGINGGNRVLAAVGKDQDDVVFLSGQVRHAIFALQRTRTKASNLLGCLINRGRKADKHGNPWRVYELNHTALCGNEIPEQFRKS